MEFNHHWTPRYRFIRSLTALLGFGGAALAGKIMIWCGLFQPGVTDNLDILSYWPGFLVGGITGALVGWSVGWLVWNKYRT